MVEITKETWERNVATIRLVEYSKKKFSSANNNGL